MNRVCHLGSEGEISKTTALKKMKAGVLDIFFP